MTDVANDLDLAELDSGARDLSGSDFSGADLSNRDLTDRNLERSNWQRADLRGANCSRSDFRGANTLQLKAQGASFVEANWTHSTMALANFSEADFRRARVEGSVLQECNFSRANLIGANFLNATFHEDSTFEGCLVDESTDLNGVRLSRALARDYVFRFYRFERGVLFRRTPEELASTIQTPPTTSASAIEIERIRRSLDEALEALSKLTAQDASPAVRAHPLQGHNNPPPDLVFSPQEHTDLTNSIQAAKQELTAEHPKPEPFEQTVTYSRAALKKSLEYVLQKVDLAITKATEEAGKTLGNPSRWPALYLVLAGKLQAVIDTIGPFLRKLM